MTAVLIREDNHIPVGWNFANIRTAATTVVKAGSGFLHSITLNTPVASGVITVYDNASGAGATIATITLPATLIAGAQTFVYDCQFNNGLTIITNGLTDLTANYI